MTKRPKSAAPRGGVSVLIVLALANLVSYAIRNSLFAAYADLRARFTVNDTTLGLLTTVFMLPHAAATLPFGWAGDRYDRRRVIAVGLLAASLASIAGAVTHNFITLASTRALAGLGTAAVVPVANSIIGQLYDGPTKASKIAIFNLGLFLGGVVGFGVASTLGFPLVVVVIGVPGIVVALVILVLPVPPVVHTDQAAASNHGLPSHAGWLMTLTRQFVGDARALFRIRTLRWVMASTTAMAFAAGGYLAWFVEFLHREKHMSNAQATTLFAASLVGGLAGILTGGRLGDALGRRFAAGRLWTIVLGMVCTVPSAIGCILLPDSAALVVASIATMFFISWYNAPVAATVDDLAPGENTVAAQALVIFCMHMFGTAPSSWILGIVSNHSSLFVAMWVPTAMVLVAAVCMAIATRTFASERQQHGKARERSL